MFLYDVLSDVFFSPDVSSEVLDYPGSLFPKFHWCEVGLRSIVTSPLR